MTFSGVSFYLSALQQSDLEIFVPPTIHYARDGGGDPDANSPLGLAGQRVMATAWFASGTALKDAQREGLLGAARECATASLLAPRCGVTSPHESVVVLRALAARVEPAMTLLQQVRAAWRRHAWGLASNTPRIWQT